MTFAAAPARADDVVDDSRQWFTDRGVTESPLEPWGVSGCVERVVGTSRERALVCNEFVDVSKGSSDKPVYRVVTHRVVVVVRKHKIVPVLDVETTIQVLDGPPPSIGQGGVRKRNAILALDLTIASDGMSATVADSTDPTWSMRESCKDAHDTPTQDEWVAFDNELIRRLCTGRGTYVWKADRFVLAPRKPTASKTPATRRTPRAPESAPR